MDFLVCGCKAKSAVITLLLRMQSQSYNSTPPPKATTALQMANKKVLYSFSASLTSSFTCYQTEGRHWRKLRSYWTTVNQFPQKARLLGDAGQTKKDVMSNKFLYLTVIILFVCCCCLLRIPKLLPSLVCVCGSSRGYSTWCSCVLLV